MARAQPQVRTLRGIARHPPHRRPFRPPRQQRWQRLSRPLCRADAMGAVVREVAQLCGAVLPDAGVNQAARGCAAAAAGAGAGEAEEHSAVG